MVKTLLQACDISRAFWTITSPRLQLFKWSAVSLTGLAFFFHVDSNFFFGLDSNFKISNRVCSHDSCLVFFRSWTYISLHFANLDSCFLLHSLYFTSFDLRIMFSTCFYHRYNFVRNGTPYRMHFFTIFQARLHSFNIKDHWSTRGLLAKSFKTFSKSPLRPAGSHFWQAPNLHWTLIELSFNIIKNLLCLFFI